MSLHRVGSVALLMAVSVGAAVAQDSPSSSPAAEETFDCARMAEVDKDDATPEALFERSLWAGHCYRFSARAVRISFDGVRTLALTHSIDQGIETEAARFLDGPPVAIEKRGGVNKRAAGSGVLDFSTGMSPAQLARHVARYYRLQPVELERIAGRAAWRLDIEPQDSLRYGYRLWLDRETALPLKQEMIDINGQVIETFQITELQNPELYQGVLSLGPERNPTTSPWDAQWLPAGFIAQPVPARSPGEMARTEHRLYSDGLTSISLFVEPITGSRPPLKAGVHRLGISFAAVRHVVHDGRPMQILVLGEAPAEVLARIAVQVSWNGTGNADAATANTGEGASRDDPSSADAGS